MHILWGEQDSNLRSRRQQIYSLPQLAALVSPRLLQKTIKNGFYLLEFLIEVQK